MQHAISPSIAPNAIEDFFDRVVVINLDRRLERWERLNRHLDEIGWPFRRCERFRAVDAAVVKPPAWWQAGEGAWGCLQSHLRVIENALIDEVQTLLVLEDDVVFPPDFRDAVQQFLVELPPGWDQLYLGGQYLRNAPPPAHVSHWVMRALNVHRTHAYAMRRDFMAAAYRWLTDYPAHAQNPRHHIDHRLGALHETGQHNVYVPRRWLAGQDEGYSDIKCKAMPLRFWPGHPAQAVQLPDFVAVLGLHRSGSSCLAGVLYHLGVHMGDKLRGYEPTGGFEAVGLVRVCEKAYPFPTTELQIPPDELHARLLRHVRYVRFSAMAKGKLAGGKYPHLCAMGPLLESICGDGLRVIHIDRPLETSIRSLLARSRACRASLHTSDEEAEKVQRWLWEQKQQFLARVEHLTVEFDRLLAEPAQQIQRVVEYLRLTPTSAQLERAVAHVRPELCHHVDRDHTTEFVSTGGLS
jgi:hypothetical protein